MTKYLLIDCSSILNPIKYKLPTLTNDEGEMTQIVFGFFKKILWLSKKFGSTDLVFFWEGTKKGKHYRKELYPLYKIPKDKEGNPKPDERTETEKEFDRACFKQFDKCREIVETIGFKNSFSQEGCESDDLLAICCEQDEHIFHNFVMCTGDEDMFQCLKNLNTIIYFVNKDKIYDSTAFEEEKGIKAEKWDMVKAIGGCKSDHVPGVKGVGEKTAIKYLNGELKETTKAYQSIKEFPKKDRVRNKRLVTIPIPQTKQIELKEDDLSMEKFMEICTDMGFDFFINDMFEEWSQFFNGSVNPASAISNRRKNRAR